MPGHTFKVRVDPKTGKKVPYAHRDGTYDGDGDKITTFELLGKSWLGDGGW